MNLSPAQTELLLKLNECRHMQVNGPEVRTAKSLKKLGLASVRSFRSQNRAPRWYADITGQGREWAAANPVRCNICLMERPVSKLKRLRQGGWLCRSDADCLRAYGSREGRRRRDHVNGEAE